mmetsp:Transcript_44427/g.123842  ORF Transcript_44427/g.123842 Transcript_44427/m.123842 type:complete len:266 (-) Transcript_44427:109-906(-)
MTIKTAVCAAVTASAASALKTQAKWGILTDLPRAELQAKDLAASGCGKDLPGYFTIEGLMWEASWQKSKVWNATECAQNCDENTHCVGFSTRRGHGKLECSLYKGLQKQPDHMATSYTKCLKGFDGCNDGFQFSHAGTWRNGKKMVRLDDEDMEECQKACRLNRGCVAFTYRVNKVDDKFCVHFEDAGNKEGPKKESRANTYTKCILEGSQAFEDNSTAEDNSTLEDAASADEQSQVIEDASPVQAPASADEQSKAPASEDEDAL